MRKTTVFAPKKSPFFNANSYKSIKSFKTMNEIQVNSSGKNHSYDVDQEQFNSMKTRLDAIQRFKAIIADYDSGVDQNGNCIDPGMVFKKQKLRQISLMENIYQVLKIRNKVRNANTNCIDNKRLNKYQKAHRPSIDSNLGGLIPDSINFVGKLDTSEKNVRKQESKRSSINILLSNTSILNQQLMHTFRRISEQNIQFTVKTIQERQQNQDLTQQYIQKDSKTYNQDNIIQSESDESKNGEQNQEFENIYAKPPRLKNCFTIIQANQSRQLEDSISKEQSVVSQLTSSKKSKKETIVAMQIENHKLRLRNKILTQKLKNEKILKYKMQRLTEQFAQSKRNKGKQRQLLSQQLEIMAKQRQLRRNIQRQQNLFDLWRRGFLGVIQQLRTIQQNLQSYSQQDLIVSIQQVTQHT